MGAKRVWPNALDGGTYFRNLSSILLERDVGRAEFGTWLSGEQPPPPKHCNASKNSTRRRPAPACCRTRAMAKKSLAHLARKRAKRPWGSAKGTSTGWCSRGLEVTVWDHLQMWRSSTAFRSGAHSVGLLRRPRRRRRRRRNPMRRTSEAELSCAALTW